MKEKVRVPQLRKLLYPPNPLKKDKERHIGRFMDIFTRLQINIPFLKAMEHMPNYAKFMKELLTNKRRFAEGKVDMEVGGSAII